MFCLKENNAKKINSHRWFFNAFAPLLDPLVCILLDVGTRPGPNSIYRLWKTFDRSSNVGGQWLGSTSKATARSVLTFSNLSSQAPAARSLRSKPKAGGNC